MKLFSRIVIVVVALLLVSITMIDAQNPGPLQQINAQLAAQGLNVRAESIEFLTIGGGRPSNRIHQQATAWVPNDERRLAQGTDLTYLVVNNGRYGGKTASGLNANQTEGAIDRAMTTWNNHSCMSTVNLAKRPSPSPSQDVTIFDYFFGFGGYGYPFAADIVNAGWWPREYFETVGGEGGGRGILAFSVTFIFTDDNGTPTDINHDNYLDAALNEVYYNDTFGDRRNDRAGNPWGINIALPGIDVETVALHENGHSLGLGHFGPPPDAVMNPVYAGIRHEPLQADTTGICIIYNNWPN